jgi:branched-subunit amino acid aminotransferase/4-amino-4-deoxychorismate lyase
MWNSHSKLNCIHACIQANTANADEALMLDPNGFVSTCNSTNFFIVRRGDRDWKTGVRELEVWAPTSKYQLHGITRHVILRLCREQGVVVREKDFSLTEVYDAAEVYAHIYMLTGAGVCDGDVCGAYSRYRG